MTTSAGGLLRDRTRARRVTNIELFFDLVYVFAVTQLSMYLRDDPTLVVALRTALLLAMVWVCWAYTTWVTNWMDPDRLAVRLLLVALMLISLAMSAALPRAFGGSGELSDLGWLVGGAYGLSQVGRSAFMVVALRGQRLQRNFQRILVWCLVSGAFAVAGGLVHGDMRVAFWVLAPGIDLLGGAATFWVPGLGSSRTTDWDIAGGHFAERCQAFILIALGESIVVTGESMTRLNVTAENVTAFIVAFLSTVTLWWIYFDRGAEAGAAVIERSEDPGRLGRSAYHLIHPIMVAGIIVVAASDENLSHAYAATTTSVAWLTLGGPALFLAGNVAFKVALWHVVPWSRLAGIVVLALLGLIAASLPELALATCVMAVLLGVAVYDRLLSLAVRPTRVDT
jgi:low temperature requirement protein LtrA